MATQRKTKFVPAHITPDARDALQQVGLEQSADVGQRLTVTRTVLALVALARQHPGDLNELIDPAKHADADLLALARKSKEEGTDSEQQ